MGPNCGEQALSDLWQYGDTSNILMAPKVFDEWEYEIDHIIPRALGGKNSYSNAQIVSKEYNRKKSDTVEERWKPFIREVDYEEV